MQSKRLISIAVGVGVLLTYLGGWVLIYGWSILPALIFDAIIMFPICYGLSSWQHERQKQKGPTP